LPTDRKAFNDENSFSGLLPYRLRFALERRLKATWYLTEQSPYMVYAEVPLPNGQVQRMTGVSLDAR
jgi:hypothetical protein